MATAFGETGRPAATASRAAIYRAVAAASIGNALEWYDLTIYLYFAVTLSKLFFPAGNDTVSLLVTLGTFGISYLMRPLGAIVLGLYADRVGRKAALTLGISLMMLGTFMMAVMPSYEQIGILASIGVMLARLLQGFSAGGEFGSSTAFMVEHGPDRKGFLASFQFASQGLSSVLASLFGVGLTTALTPDQLAAWGWRLPFVFGLLIGPVGLYIRRHVDETPEFSAAAKKADTTSALRTLFATQWPSLLVATGLVATSTALNYLISYMPTYATKQLGLPQWIGFAGALIGGVMLTVVPPFVGHWSDRIGRLPVMRGAALSVLVLSLPAFLLLTGVPTLAVVLAVLALVGALKASYSAALPALMSEIFATRTRSTGMNLSYSIGVTLFGGFAPFWNESLIALTRNTAAPAYYLMLVACLSLVCLLVVRGRLRPS